MCALKAADILFSRVHNETQWMAARESKLCRRDSQITQLRKLKYLQFRFDKLLAVRGSNSEANETKSRRQFSLSTTPRNDPIDLLGRDIRTKWHLAKRMCLQGLNYKTWVI